MAEKQILVTNIQRFSLHDGPGIRTTVFLKGCALRCPWCSNPENQVSKVQKYVKDGTPGIYGEYYEEDELYREIVKDRSFYRGELSDYHITDPACLYRLPGGVTFSGGEALLQANELEPLLMRLQKEHIHIAVETCLFINPKLLKSVLAYIDLFYVDVKILNADRCRRILGGEISLFLENLQALLRESAPTVFRLPVIGGYTDSEENLNAVIELLREYRPLKVELLKEHNLGADKYRSLGLESPKLIGVSDAFLEFYREKIEKTGVVAEICRL